MTKRRSNRVYWILGIVVVAAVAYCLIDDDCTLLTPDQEAYKLYEAGDYQAAVDGFADPMWRGVCLFRQGEFEDAAGVYSGYDSPDAAFNQGNSLVMLGEYDDAIARYDRALELRPEWEPALVNREIAVARAAALVQEGGEGTGGKLEADEIVFSDKKSPPSDQQEQTDGGEPMSDEELRSIWLRQVQTKPADFLRSKFAYQAAMRKTESEGAEE